MECYDFKKIYNYLLECTNIEYTVRNYRPKETIPGLDLAAPTISQIKRNAAMSDNSAQKFATAFSALLKDQTETRIEPSDFSLSVDLFKKKFPAKMFRTKDAEKKVDLKLFANQTYRGYYMTRNSSTNACMAFFRLVNGTDTLKAYMVRGIQQYDVSDTVTVSSAENIQECMSNNPEKLMHLIQDLYKKDEKVLSSIHLFVASGNHDITYTNNCIKIDFQSVEPKPCRCTMFWNISNTNEYSKTNYIGGTCLIVDTNDGARGKSSSGIQAFMMGFESVAPSSTIQQQYISRGPISLDSQQLINELSLKSHDGILSIDNNIDNHFYHFIQKSTYRVGSPFQNNLDINALISSMANLKAQYEQQLEYLKEYLDKLNTEK